MNEKCKYCNNVSKCSQYCEYDSIVCKLYRSFPKVVNKSYDELMQENQKLKEKIKEIVEYAYGTDMLVSEYEQLCKLVEVE